MDHIITYLITHWWLGLIVAPIVGITGAILANIGEYNEFRPIWKLLFICIGISFLSIAFSIGGLSIIFFVVAGLAINMEYIRWFGVFFYTFLTGIGNVFLLRGIYHQPNQEWKALYLPIGILSYFVAILGLLLSCLFYHP